MSCAVKKCSRLYMRCFSGSKSVLVGEVLQTKKIFLISRGKGCPQNYTYRDHSLNFSAVMLRLLACTV